MSCSLEMPGFHPIIFTKGVYNKDFFPRVFHETEAQNEFECTSIFFCVYRDLFIFIYIYI